MSAHKNGQSDLHLFGLFSTVCANNKHSINKWNLKIPKRCVCVRDVKNSELNTPMLRLLLEQNIFAINLLKHQLGGAN